MTGRSPFTPTRGPEQNRNYFFGANRTLIRNRSSFNAFLTGLDSFDTPNINVALGGRTRSEALAIRTPRDNVTINANVDYALTLDQTLMGPLGRRAFTRTRVQVGWTDSELRSVIEAPTIRVNDAFTRGGAQVAGGQHSRSIGVGSDLDYVRGIHTVRTGVQIHLAALIFTPRCGGRAAPQRKYS